MHYDDLTKTQLDTAGITPMSDSTLERRYDEVLDEIYPNCSIAGHNYQTSRVLKEVDPTAYRCGMADWSDAECGETLYCLFGEYYDVAEIDGLIIDLEAEDSEDESEESNAN